MANTTIEDVLKKYIYKNIEGFGDGLTVDGAEQACIEYASLNRQGWTRVEDLIAELKTWVTANSENHTDMDIAYWNVIKYLERLKSMPLPNETTI